jgi:nicotinamide-nucleotide adenylyltransferase
MIHPPASIIPPGFASHALQLLQKVQHGISPVELIYTAHEHWPYRSGHTVHTRPTLRISVLDSSFNPPTLAHLALANSPPPLSPQRSSATFTSAEPYDARILLLSVHNVDKALKPGDATFVQRLEMMHLLSYDIRSIDTAESSGEASQMSDNVAVAIIDEPTFVGKSTVLLRFLQTRMATVIESSNSSTGNSISNKRDASYPFPSPKLTFLLGFDTLARLFSPKYYPSELVMVQMLRSFLSPDQEDCHIVCAYRRSASADKTFQQTQDKTLEVPHGCITSDRIAFIDIGAEGQTYSSSEVRAKVPAGNGRWKRLVTDVIANYIIERGIYSGSEK